MYDVKNGGNLPGSDVEEEFSTMESASDINSEKDPKHV